MLAGIIPVLLWLWFWEHEDKHPEPIRLVVSCFIGGMISVLVALELERAAAIQYDIYRNLEGVIWVWAVIEELLKYLVAYLVALRRTENDEPIDAMMYMITVALGFAALENAFFLFNPIINGDPLQAAITGNTRFIGATLLHTISSGVAGLMIGLAFYKSVFVKRVFTLLGIGIAIVLHALFNLAIISYNGGDAILPFYAVWIAVIGILLAFEKVKRIKKPTS